MVELQQLQPELRFLSSIIDTTHELVAFSSCHMAKDEAYKVFSAAHKQGETATKTW